MASLEYLQAPAVGLYWIGACAYSLCVLQKSALVTHTRRRGILALTAVTLLAYLVEVLYYFSMSMAEREYEPPKPAAIRCLGSILVWSPLFFQNWINKTVRWHPYFGAFVLHFAFETTTCLMTGFGIPTHDKQQNVTFVIGCIRAVASLILLLDAFAIFITKHVEQSSDEERQSLLSKPANGTANGSAAPDYGAIHVETTADDEEEPKDRDQELKDQQAKRL